MARFYFTYGTDGQPFFGGWTEVEAPDAHAACAAFRAYHPDKTKGLPGEVGDAMNGKLKDWSFSRTGESVLTITTRESCKKLWDALGDQEITFSIKRRVIPRSLNANNYAWSLIEKLAVAVKSDKDSVYEEMLRRYGTGETYTDEAGNECKVLFSLREGVPPALVARHYAETGVGYVEGKKFIHYRAIKGTSEYSTKEMSVFLDGIISECQEVGIETDTPEQIARYKEAWHP